MAHEQLLAQYSVAMTTWNGERFVCEQLDSILAQSTGPSEIVVCDDASDDATWDILLRYRAEARAEIVLLRNAERAGARRSVERAISNTRSPWIFVSDQDDVWLPEKAHRYLTMLQGKANATIACSDSRIVDESLRPTGRSLWEHLRFGKRYQLQLMGSSPFSRLLRFPALPGHGLAFARKLLPHLFPLPAYWYPDEWISLVGSAMGDIVLDSEPQTLYRQHSNQWVSAGQAGHSRQRTSRKGSAAKLFLRDLERLREMRQRLGDTLTTAEFKEIAPCLDRREDLLTDRLRMRESPVARRLFLIARNLVRRSYWRSGRGWLAVARDLLGA